MRLNFYQRNRDHFPPSRKSEPRFDTVVDYTTRLGISNLWNWILSMAVLNFYASAVPAGHFKLWYNRDIAVNQTGVPTTIQENGAFQFRVGLYVKGWSNGNYAGNQPFRQIWFDEIGFRTTFADADPDQW